ncbi:uncharacterized protein [Macrobrachium rosenbergii]|uniref:uncharacterized protein isoform X1 n=2 Tax=Macrobrachium rosenbergii TaxID=79674 RepID=UPI0034D6F467
MLVSTNMRTILLLQLVAFQLAVVTQGLNVIKDEEKKVVIAKCPSLTSGVDDDPNSFCECLSTPLPASRESVQIKCSFNNTEDVLLNEALYPFRNMSLGSAYVRVVNATRVNVTQAFLRELMQSPSIALDIWGAGTLVLDSMPDPETDKFKKFKTFVGVGISDCYVPEVPKYFLRNRTRGGLRIKKSRVGNFRAGVLHNMEEMRYLVFEDSTIHSFEGSVATEGFVVLSKRQLHAWTGLVISNTTIDTIGSGTFNLTHKSDMEIAKVVNSTIGSLNKEAIILAGDIDVTIQKNVFQRMETEAIKVAVTGDVIFDKNEIANWEPGALEGLICHKRTSLEENTFRVQDPTDIAMNISTTPFHASCGNPQLFLVIKPQQPLALQINSTSSWILGFLLFLIVVGVVMAGVYLHQRQNLALHYYRNRGRLPLPGLRERKVSQENLPNGAEIDPSSEVTEEGVSNPIYVDVNESN